MNTPKAVVSQVKTSDTLVVVKRCAVHYWASEQRLEQLKKETQNEDDFYVAADDASWYSYESTEYLDSITFPVLRTKGYRYVRFKKTDGSSVYLDTDTIKGFTNIYFFDPAKNPKEADMTGIWDSFAEYFGKE